MRVAAVQLQSTEDMDRNLADADRLTRAAAADGAERLGTPSGRWEAIAALGKALYATGDDDGAAVAYGRAADVIRAFAATLQR